MINLKKHDKKTQEIKMEEDDDYDEELELFHGRYQNSYLVVEKEFPQTIPPDDDSDAIEEPSHFTHSLTKFNENNGFVDMSRASPVEPLAPSSNNPEREEKSEYVKKSDVSVKEKRKSSILEESSNRSSVVENHKKATSVSSRQRNAAYSSNLSIGKPTSERKSMAHWVEEEKEEFKKQLSVHGKDWKRISQVITNKTEKQIRNFYQNYKKKMNLEELLPSQERGRGKKLESGLSGLKRTRSFNNSVPSFNKRAKKRKVISSDNSDDNSLSQIEEEKYESDHKVKAKEPSESSSVKESPKKPKRRDKKVISNSSPSKSSSSSKEPSESGSVESSLSSSSSGSESKSAEKDVTPNYESGDSLD